MTSHSTTHPHPKCVRCVQLPRSMLAADLYRHIPHRCLTHRQILVIPPCFDAPPVLPPHAVDAASASALGTPSELDTCTLVGLLPVGETELAWEATG